MATNVFLRITTGHSHENVGVNNLLLELAVLSLLYNYQ